MNLLKQILLGAFLCLFLTAPAQHSALLDSNQTEVIVVAGPEYGKSGFHQFLWGKNHRKAWITPVRIPWMFPETHLGGLEPLRLGGGRQTETLHMITKDEKRFVFRSVNKTYTRALPEDVAGSFIETIANDQISTNHPYGALIVPALAAAAGVYHTNPSYYVMKLSPVLEEHNDPFAGMLGLFEERPDKSHLDVSSFGFPENIISTENMLEKIEEENDHMVDQPHYLKTRLFDMLLGDWGRHQDNWRWAKFDEGPFKIYRPVPKDRDQIFAVFEGMLMSLIKGIAGLDQLQSFDHTIKDIRWYNFPALDIDRRFTNQLTRQQWLDTAKALQLYLSDAVIEAAVRNMPPEIFAIDGADIISKIRSRRDRIVHYAEAYYEFLAGEVDIPGTLEKENFYISATEDGLMVSVRRVNKHGEETQEIFSRKFSAGETKEIRLYGLKGNDAFHVSGDAQPVRIRIIGGNERDTLHNQYAGRNIFYYDSPGNYTASGNRPRFRISSDSLVHHYDFERRKIPSSGLKKTIFYDDFYRFHVGLGYGITTHAFRKEPFASKHVAGLNYSLTERSWHPYYRGYITSLIGNWDLSINAGYDGIRRINFFGIGNDSEMQTQDTRFHWLRTSHLYSGISFIRKISRHHIFTLSGLYEGVKVVPHNSRFVSRDAHFIDAGVLDFKHFGSAGINYEYINVNDMIVPSKGIQFIADYSHTFNLEQSNSFRNLRGDLKFFIPLFRPFSLAIKSGAGMLRGEPEFYQLNKIGGNYEIRGYERWRFYGNDYFFNQNELRWLPQVRSRIFNGRAGLMALFDHGRVWHPGEQSDTWHYGYGGGIILVPFNRLSLGLTYAKSREDREFNFRFLRFF